MLNNVDLQLLFLGLIATVAAATSTAMSGAAVSSTRADAGLT